MLSPRRPVAEAAHLRSSAASSQSCVARNVRQLQNVISRCCSIASSDEISASDLEPWMEKAEGEPGDPGMTLAQMERKLIEATFNRFGGNRELTAKALEIGIRTLSGKLREYAILPRGGPGSNKISKWLKAARYRPGFLLGPFRWSTVISPWSLVTGGLVVDGLSSLLALPSHLSPLVYSWTCTSNMIDPSRGGVRRKGVLVWRWLASSSSWLV